MDGFQKKTDPEFYTEMLDVEKKGSKAPQNFIYPFKIYSKSLNREGAEVKVGMKVSDINKKRAAADLFFLILFNCNMQEANNCNT